MIQSVAILGSTGSIGRQALDVCKEYGIRVCSLSCHSNVSLLFDQIQYFQPAFVTVADENKAKELALWMRRDPSAYTCEVLAGESALLDVATTHDADMVLAAMVGMAGIKPVLAAIRSGHDLALANKEVLVSAGELVMEEARKANVSLHPVDSEHSAIWQCLKSGKRNELRRVILTASGGPFRNVSKEKLARVNPKQALAHPTWEMGSKISIDSATLMNKGLEVIEAARLFNLKRGQIDVVIHPQSIIHSMVEWQDGSVIAQLGEADMKLPIQLAFSWPQRLANSGRSFNFLDPQNSRIEFEAVDTDMFRALPLAYEALDAGGTMPAIYNAANEIAVAAFLAEKISFTGITETVEEMMLLHVRKGFINHPSLDDIMEADRQARLLTLTHIQS